MSTFRFATDKSCSHEPKKVFEIEGIEYHASNKKNVINFHGDLVINLTTRPLVYKNPYFKELYEFFNFTFEEIMVPCPDFGIPLVDNKFWKEIHMFAKMKKYTKVCIQCGQAHGRTGTILSAILIANARFSAKDSVELVRGAHCDHAVESPEQSIYLVELDSFYNERIPDEESVPTPSVFINTKHLLTNE